MFTMHSDAWLMELSAAETTAASEPHSNENQSKLADVIKLLCLFLFLMQIFLFESP